MVSLPVFTFEDAGKKYRIFRPLIQRRWYKIFIWYQMYYTIVFFLDVGNNSVIFPLLFWGQKRAPFPKRNTCMLQISQLKQWNSQHGTSTQNLFLSTLLYEICDPRGLQYSGNCKCPNQRLFYIHVYTIFLTHNFHTLFPNCKGQRPLLQNGRKISVIPCKLLSLTQCVDHNAD